MAVWTAASPGLTYRCTDRRLLCPVLAMMTLAETLASPRWVATGTRLINRDVPQEVVRVLLDHDSHMMTAHYG